MKKYLAPLALLGIFVFVGCFLGADKAAAPTGVVASQGRYSHIVILTWDAVSGASSYNVYFSNLESGEYSYAGNTTDAAAMIGPSGVIYGEHYFYKVAILSPSGSEGEQSAAAEGWTGSTSDYSSMFWTEEDFDTIEKSLPNGRSISTVLNSASENLYEIRDIAIDRTANKLYLTDQGADSIHRCNLDGTGLETLVSTGILEPIGIALDTAAGKMYWTEYGNTRIRSADLDGMNGADFITGLSDPIDIALDVAGGYMYWTDWTDGAIYRTVFPSGSATVPILTSLSKPWGIELDATNGKIYFSEFVSTNNGRVSSVNTDGSGKTLLWDSLNDARGIALDVEDDMLLFSDGDSIFRQDLTNGLTEEIVEGYSRIYAIAFD